MKAKIKETLENCLPPFLVRALKTCLSKSIVYRGAYASWEEALNNSSGYVTEIILDKVKQSLLMVKDGRAIYERDSILFDTIQYSWPLLSGLLWVASQSDNKLNLVDFGGSLGSSYYQNIKFLSHLRDLRWNIIEQDNFVRYGRQYFENQHVKFYNNWDECLRQQEPNLVIFSGVLQYVRDPYAELALAISKGFKHIIFDRTPVLEKGADRLTVQTVPACIYKASYPAWFFNKKKLMQFMEKNKFDLIAEFDALGGDIRPNNALARTQGFIYKRA